MLLSAQGSGQLELPNPYRLVESWPTLPPEMNGGRWGELIRAQLDPDGNFIAAWTQFGRPSALHVAADVGPHTLRKYVKVKS